MGSGNRSQFVALALCLAVLAGLLAVACGPKGTDRSPPPTATLTRSVPRAAAAPAPQRPARFPPPNLRFERITGEKGLSSNTVRCILQDSQGFVWQDASYRSWAYLGLGESLDSWSLSLN